MSTAPEARLTPCLCVHDLLRQRAAQSPEAPALAAPDRRAMSYGQLLAQVEGTVAALNGCGIGRNDRVALVLPNGPEMAAALLGVSCAATCAPLNPGFRENEFDFEFADLRVQALVVLKGDDSPARAVALRHGLAIAELAPQPDAPAGTFTLSCLRAPAQASRNTGFAQSEDLIFLLHTSGTTARPKIVPLRQRNVCISAFHNRRSLELSASDRCLNVMSLFHSMGMTALMTTLTAGGSIVCCPGFHAPLFFPWLAAHRPTWFTAAPAIHQSILQRAGEHAEVTGNLSLRFVRSGSSPLPMAVLDEIERVFGVPLVEGYGMSETPLIASNSPPPLPCKPGSVGRPCGMDIAIIGEDGKLLEPERSGEIVIRGPHLMSGYENNPEANARSFTPDGWFHTGDLGYLDADGFLFINGRSKEIINRGGAKIAPREVDEVVLAHPAVRDALTFAVPDAKLGESVGVAVVLKPGGRLSDVELRQYAAERLVDYKVPGRVVFVEQIPLGPTGKPQRVGMAQRLGLDMVQQRAAAEARAGERRPLVAPRTPLEVALAGIWRHVLDLAEDKPLGIHEHFLDDCGGDSILAVSLFAEIERVLGPKLSAAALLAAPTIAQLAEAVARDGWSLEDHTLVAIQPHGSLPPLFCLPGRGGHSFTYYPLSRRLGRNQPFYGLQLPGVDGKRAPFRRIEDLAAFFIEQIRQVQPEGPYFLGGYSFGGRVAYEMARQLRGAGEAIGLLALFDTPAPGYPPKPTRAQRVGYHLRELTALPMRAKIAYLRSHWRGGTAGAEAATQVAPGTAGDPPTAMPDALRQVEAASLHAMRSYVAGRYDGTVTLFRAKDRPRWKAVVDGDPAMGWGGPAQRVDVRLISGEHLTIFNEPNLRDLAEQLQRCLAAAQSQCAAAVPV